MGRRQRWSAGVLTAALVGSLLIYRSMWLDPAHRTVGSARHINDSMQSMWSLKWVAWCLIHFHNPLRTTVIDYPSGVSLSWNTLTSTLGVIAAPVTLVAGAAVTYSVLMTLGPALTALTGYWWLRRHTGREWPAALGGFLIGFNPYMGGHMIGHLDLTFTALIPLILMLCEDLLWRSPRATWKTAGLLGLVTAAQAGINEELLLIVAVAVLIALTAALVVDRRWVTAQVRAAAPGLTLAVGVFAVAAAPLLIEQLVLSPPVPLQMSSWGVDLRDYLLPNSRLLLNGGTPFRTKLGAAEDGVYLGPVLLLVLVAGVAMTAKRDRLVRVAAVTLAGLAVLTLGTTGPGGVALPWRLVAHLPIFMSILPVRFTFALFLVVAWLIARWLTALSSSVAWPSRLAVAIVVVAVLGLVPRGVTTAPLPKPITYEALPSGSPALLLPLSSWRDAAGMYYQQEADFRFSQPSGYALRPDGTGVSYGPPQTPLIQLADAAEAGWAAKRIDPLIAAARRQLADEHYGAIIVVRTPLTRWGDALARQLTGRPPTSCTAQVCVWVLRSRLG